MLKNEIRKKIVETKERKEKLLIEEKLVESRIMMIVESKDNFKNFHLLSEEKQLKLGFSLMREFHFLSHNGLLNEQLGDFLSKIFGNSLSAVSQMPPARRQRPRGFQTPCGPTPRWQSPGCGRNPDRQRRPCC